jgi:hypothetical protein
VRGPRARSRHMALVGTGQAGVAAAPTPHQAAWFLVRGDPRLASFAGPPVSRSPARVVLSHAVCL